MSIFKTFDAILSALTKEQYRPYYEAYYSKQDGKSFSEKKKLLEELINTNREYTKVYVFNDKINEAKTNREVLKIVCGDELAVSYNDIRSGSIADTIMQTYPEFTRGIGDLEGLKNTFKNSLEQFIEPIHNHINRTSSPDENLEWSKSFAIKGLQNALLDVRMRQCEILENETSRSKMASPYLKSVYDPLFGNKRRLVLPVDPSLVTELLSKSMPKEEFNKFILYPVAVTYFEDIGNERESKAAREFINRIAKHELSESDIPDYYSTGKYKMFSDKREIRVGKMLGYVQKKDLLWNRTEELERTNTAFNQRVRAKKDKEYILVLSRHPYDIAGMSTDRGWKSCMNIVNGVYRRYVMSSLINGVIVGYLCYSTDTTDINGHTNDKPNIQHPLGRILIKPMIRRDERIDFENPNFILVCSKTYGTFPDPCVGFLQSWFDKNWNINIEGGRFDFDRNNFYKEPDDYYSVTKDELINR